MNRIGTQHRAALLGGALLLVGGLVIASCGDDPAGPPDADQVPGHYVLESIGGQGLPVDTGDPGREVWISWGLIILAGDGTTGTCFVQEVYLLNDQYFPFECDCEYTRSGSDLTLVSTTQGTWIQPEATISRDRLVRPTGSGDFVYRRITLP